MAGVLVLGFGLMPGCGCGPWLDVSCGDGLGWEEVGERDLGVTS